MANPLSRTWYNTLIDDDGSGTTGTIWNKAQVDGLLDTVDASLASIVDKTGTPASMQIGIFNDPDTLTALPNLTADPQGGIAIEGAGYPNISMRDTTRPVDQQFFRVVNTGGKLETYAINNAGSVLATPLTLNRGGDVSIGRTLYLAGAVTFPATQVPSADVNTLDDYRELPYTPVVLGQGGQSGQVYGVQTGNYVKVGRLVAANFAINLSTVGTISGSVMMSLPFPAATGAQGIMVWANTTASFYHMLINLDPSYGAAGILTGIKAATTNSSGTVLVQADLQAGTYLIGTVVYRSVN